MKKVFGVLAAAVFATVTAGVHADSQAIMDKHCKACHNAGLAGAPKLGDKAAWAPRVEKGVDAMVQTVVAGKGAMPKMGTCNTCDEATLKAVVELMVNQ